MTAPVRGLLPGDVYLLHTVGEVTVSPDGSQVAFVVTRPDRARNTYGSAIWLAGADGAEPAVPVTDGRHRDGLPRWSPSGDRIAFVSHRGDSGSEIRVLRLGGGESGCLLALPGGEVEALEWSPDGSRLAFLARDPDPERPGDLPAAASPPRRLTHLRFRAEGTGWTHTRPRQVHLLPAAGGVPRRLTDAAVDHEGLAWSPDGGALVTVAGDPDRFDVDYTRELVLLDAATGERRQLTATGGSCGAPAWSEQGLACVLGPAATDRIGHRHLVLVDPATGGCTRLLPELDRSVAAPAWSGEQLHVLVEDGGRTHVLRSDGTTVVGGEGEAGSFAARGGTLAYSWSTPDRPPEVFAQRGGSPPRQLTALGAGLTAARRLLPAERFAAPSEGGGEVDAWLVAPEAREGERLPVLLSIHGGPFAQYGTGFFDEFQVYAAAGYAVVYANPRGSAGRSESWATAICGPHAPTPGAGWGEPASADVLAALDTALARFPFLDPDRLGVLGGSYGGYLTSWIVGHTDRFRAACSERAVNNLVSFSSTSDMGLFLQSYFGRSYLEAAEHYLQLSPIVHADRITTPLLVLHSDEDYRCPVAQAEELFSALRLAGRTVELVRFPGEGHELSRSGSPVHRVQRFEVILEWFDRHLGAARESAVPACDTP